MNYGRRGPFEAPFTRLLLDRGADPKVRATLREQVGQDEKRTTRTHLEITALRWGERFHDRIFVSEPAMRLLS